MVNEKEAKIAFTSENLHLRMRNDWKFLRIPSKIKLFFSLSLLINRFDAKHARLGQFQKGVTLKSQLSAPAFKMWAFQPASSHGTSTIQYFEWTDKTEGKVTL